MKRNLIEDLHQYFELKDDRTGSEVSFLNQLAEELPSFQITAISRDDLAQRGFDVSNVDDEDMRELARKMNGDYRKQLFYSSMEIIAKKYFNIPKYMCPKCGKNANSCDQYSKRCQCGSCDSEWDVKEPSGRYVLVEDPEDSKFYSDCEIGYDCCNYEDNGAMYVPEHFYKAHTDTEPDTNKLFVPIMRPESQEYLELQYTDESTFEQCELIEYGNALRDFDTHAIWVPLSLLNKKRHGGRRNTQR